MGENTKEITFAGFNVDAKRVIQHLKQDLKDDWIPDWLEFREVLNVKTIRDQFYENVDGNNGLYEPSHSCQVDIPKSNFTIRYALETGLLDRFVYQGCISKLATFIDPALPSRVLSHRVETSSHSGRRKYLFRNAIEQWKIFEGLTKAGFERGKVLLVTDVFNYYENVNIDKLHKNITNMLCEVKADGGVKSELRSCIDLIIRCLKKWSLDGVIGLPQNRDASSFLSNVVMKSVDRNMIDSGADYYRYVDDIRVICNDVHHARNTLQCIVRELRKIGLNVNSKKTMIIESTSSDAYAEVYTSDNSRIEQIDVMFKSRKKEVIARSIPLLVSYARSLIEDGKTQDRAFRFCIGRLERVIGCGQFDPGDEVVSSLVEEVIRALPDHAVSSDTLLSFVYFCDITQLQYDKLVDLICDRNVAIYKWQNFHIWRLFIHRGYFDRRLDELAIRVLGSGKCLESSAAVIYLASRGILSPDALNDLSSGDPFFYQRAVLIGLHNENLSRHYGGLLERLRPDVRKTEQRVKSSSYRGSYFVKREPYSFREIYDQLPRYE